jgi:3-oxoacyl-[acyl-carrier protein] reductase
LTIKSKLYNREHIERKDTLGGDMDLKLNGKRALVTGASQGLGFATARGLALEGCRVAISSRDMEKLGSAARNLEGEAQTQVVPIPGDMTDPEFASSLVKTTVNVLGGLDILVTNAGGPPAGKFETFDDATWQQAVELSFLSHVRLIRAALPLLKASPTPSVLTVTSITVKEPLPNLILSNSVRMATAGLTKSLAQELGPEGIRFNSILPGWTVTERVENLMSHRAEISNSNPQEEFEKQSAAIPLGRMGSTEEFANAAVFLLSPAASYITGVMLQVDGGLYAGTL